MTKCINTKCTPYYTINYRLTSKFSTTFSKLNNQASMKMKDNWQNLKIHALTSEAKYTAPDISCIPDVNIHVNPRFWTGSDISIWPWCSYRVVHVQLLRIGCNGRHKTWSLTNVTRRSENDVKIKMADLDAAYFKVKC